MERNDYHNNQRYEEIQYMNQDLVREELNAALEIKKKEIEENSLITEDDISKEGIYKKIYEGIELKSRPSLLVDVWIFVIYIFSVTIMATRCYKYDRSFFLDMNILKQDLNSKFNIFSYLITFYVIFFSIFENFIELFYTANLLILSFLMGNIFRNMFFKIFGKELDYFKFTIPVVFASFLILYSIFSDSIGYLRNSSFKGKMRNKIFSSVMTKLFFPGFLTFFSVCAIFYLRRAFFWKETSGIEKAFSIFLDITTCLLMQEIFVGIFIWVLFSKSLCNMIKFIPTLFAFSLLRPIIFILAFFKQIKHKKTNSLIKRAYASVHNFLFAKLEHLVRRFSIHDTYFAIVFSLAKKTPCAYSFQMSKRYAESDVFYTEIKDVPLMKILFPFIITITYFFHCLSITPWILKLYFTFLIYTIVDIVCVPLYYFVLVNFNNVNKINRY